MADMENLRRRTEREVADARAYAVANFARDMLNVADNVRRGIETVSDEARASAEGAFKGLIEGIDLTERDLLKILERHGVKKLDPMGQKFDPHLHQAMFEVPNPDVAERHGRAGRAVRLRDRRAGPAPGSGRRCQGRSEGQRQRARRTRAPPRPKSDMTDFGPLSVESVGVAVFALSGALVAARKGMDPFGFALLATVTGVGGGTLRDLLIGTRPVFWVGDPTRRARLSSGRRRDLLSGPPPHRHLRWRAARARLAMGGRPRSRAVCRGGNRKGACRRGSSPLGDRARHRHGDLRRHHPRHAGGNHAPRVATGDLRDGRRPRRRRDGRPEIPWGSIPS